MVLAKSDSNEIWRCIVKNLGTLWTLVILLALGAGESAGQYAWRKDARNPVLSGGAVGAWNREVIGPCVLYNSDSLRYEMWFSGSSGTTSDWRPHFVGFATSTDRINWKMHPSAVLSPTPGTWDAYTVELPMVIRENGQYKMWYSSYLNVSPTYPGYFGYATSPDGVNWTKYSGNPVMGPGTSAWEAGGPYTCAVMPSQGGYKMWYAGWDVYSTFVCIGYAISSDGISWQRDTVHNPVLKNGAFAEWDHVRVFNPHVIQLGMYHMWYEGSSGSSTNIGYATSEDSGITWTKYATNPVLSYSPGTWEASMVESGSVLLRSTKDSLDMWYSGGDHNSVVRIGHATAPNPLVAVSDVNRGVPKVFALDQNYPNPFNPTTVVSFQLPMASEVRLVVYDLLGREVAVVANERRTAGSHEVRFDGSGLSTGVYFYRLTAGKYTETRKMILVK